MRLGTPIKDLRITHGFVAESCIHCAADFAMSDQHFENVKRTGNEFWCPACGKSMVYRKTKEQELKEQLKRAREDADWYLRRKDELYQETQRLEKSRAAFKGQVTKLKHRAANGVCPCCTRHFTNLERHMKTKHPEFTQENQP